MKKRADITIRFAANGIIVTPVHSHSDYSNPEMRDELVFSSVVEFEKWFEHHTGEGDENDPWPWIDNGRSNQISPENIKAHEDYVYQSGAKAVRVCAKGGGFKTPQKHGVADASAWVKWPLFAKTIRDPLRAEILTTEQKAHSRIRPPDIGIDLASTKDVTEMCSVSIGDDGAVKVKPLTREEVCLEPVVHDNAISERALEAAHDVVHKFKGAK
ncbi:MAG: hypothetical protein OEQ39_04175 [Gammaproteobacteria bacterium]|nr:hypothetical protein [Gammaproteobacteria bacterium]MDH3466191.1 hypothetical protein [Gammaproteobacteria bacterium]